ncbi:chemotaxis protein CheW [Paenibacillus tarimensis]
MVDNRNMTLDMEEEDTQKGKYLTFPLDKENYGIEIRFVTEIVGIQAITSVPQMPNYVKGIINLRGKIIPVMDVRLRFRKEQQQYHDRTCIIVIDIHGITIGLIVDSVNEVIPIADEHIVPPPKMNKEFQNRFIQGIARTGNDIKLLVDCDKLINEEDIPELDQLAQNE